ncbi:hypothetical protein GcM1_175023 [Golovinomyces cichoracearum]|uniref:Uncharacterized protein n=1 Tax=Golovinomyces cichoracearum TaxID=62708 RepID=A0A420J5N4_9PEZI|nr:hypothetical protein GcM1_175023 [Golovinomyces cichoracearum]
MSEEAELLYESFCIVYQNPDHLVDVYGVTWFDELIKCYKICNLSPTPLQLNSNLSPSRTNDEISGYQCGSKFICQDLVNANLEIALGRINIETAGYADLSEIFTKTESSKRMWPLVDSSQPSPTENCELIGTHYLITDKRGLFIEVGFLSFPQRYRKCETAGSTHQNTLDPTSSSSNSEDVEEGYLCDIFFADDYL